MVLGIAFCIVLGLQDTDGSRTAGDVLRDLNRIHFPQHSDGASPEAIARFERRVHEAADRTTRLAQELFDVAPEHDETPRWMKIRWDLIITVYEDPERVLRETEDILETYRGKALGIITLYHQAFAALELERFDWDAKLERIRRFERAAPGSESWARLVWRLLEEHTPELETKQRLAQRLLEDAPSSSLPYRRARTLLESIQRVGEPFELEFEDALSSEKVSIEDYRGQVVLVHFWGGGEASRADLQSLTELKRQHGEELAIVGVMQAGSPDVREELLALARERGWPQYDELAPPGATPFDCFSHRQGIRRWPQVFLIDREGRLASVRARDELEKRVREQVGIARDDRSGRSR